MEDGKMVAIAAVFGPTLILKGLVATLISDVGIYLLLGGLCLFFLIIGIALVTGHAIELVAGVNSMTESERRGYNLKKVKGRRIVHILLFGDAATDPEFQCGIVRSLRERLPAGHHLASLVHRCTLLQGGS